MKYIVYAINYPTLCRALRYIDTQWGKENSILMYATLVSPLPKNIPADYNIIEIEGYNRGRIGGLKGIYADCMTAHSSWKKLKRILKNTNEEFTLVVFRDNEAPEATIIENTARLFSDRFHLWIIEEGVGLYRTDRNPIKLIPLKKMMYRILGISTYALKNVSQGEHPRIEEIICQQPQWAAEKFKGKLLKQQIPVFVPEFNARFAEYVLGAAPDSQSNFDYVFLTTPYAAIAPHAKDIEEKYAALLDNMVRFATASGRLLIKCHPRDTHNYQKYAQMNNVKVCSALENQVPFECLYDYYGAPQVISLGSSFTLDNPTCKPTILIHKLLGMPTAIENMMARHVPESTIICLNEADLEKVLTK